MIMYQILSYVLIVQCSTFQNIVDDDYVSVLFYVYNGTKQNFKIPLMMVMYQILFYVLIVQWFRFLHKL
jgi:hypothetical protein